EEIINLSVMDIHPKEDLPYAIERFDKQWRQEITLANDIPVLRKDGTIFYADINTSLVSLNEKSYMQGIFRDVTERKQAEEALQAGEKKYRNLFENLYDIYYSTDSNGVITLISPSIEGYFGYKPDELIGRKIKDFYIDPNERENFLKILIRDGYVNNFDAQLKRKDNSVIWVSTNAKILRDEKGDFIGAEGIARDVTELKHIEKEKIKLESQLLQSQKLEAIGSLAGGIAHDFNNILSSIIGFTELALDEVEKDTNIEDSLQEVYAAGKRAKDLVRQILAFARQSKEEIKPIQVDLITKEVIKFIRSSIPTTIEIKQNIESDSLIMGNATQLHQTLMNLCTNAAHAMEDKGGILEVGLKDVIIDSTSAMAKLGLKPANYIQMKVSDTGVGIPPDILGSIFDPYFTTKGPGEGTGMGLAMVHGIVTGYEGEITVESTVGEGTVFTIYLPLTNKRSEPDLYKKGVLPTGTERILFVDDELSIAKMSGHILESLGYKVTVRTSSVEALELFKARANDFDIVITDMTMPNMTGDKLAAALIKIRPEIPVIICTGYSKELSPESAADVGIKAFTYKPIIKSDLAKTVRNVLDEAKGNAQG
ncbi:MAG: PAS domain S-box protein, partial [Pseudomonadota bacterium]